MKLLSKFLNRYLPLFLSLVLVVLAVFVYLTIRPENKEADAAWYSSSWGYRKPVTIDKNKLSTTATTTFSNFPMLFSVTDTDLKYTSFGGKVGKTDGTDIVFTSSDGITKLDHEIEKYSSSTGETIIWVRIPTLSAAADTVLYVYFGNSGASDQQNKTGVWESRYKFISHYTGTSTLVSTDSTSNNHSITNSGASLAAGKIGGSADFESSEGDFQTITYSSALSPSAITTFSAWVNRESEPVSGGSYIMELLNNFVPSSVFFRLGCDGNVANRNKFGLVFYTGSFPAICSTSDIAPATWTYIVATTDGTNGKLYINGVEDLNTSFAHTPGANSADNTIGQLGGGGRNLDAMLDEMRVSYGVARSFDWIKTEYNNQSSPGTFYAYGALSIERSSALTSGGSLPSSAAWYSSSWGYRKPVTIDKNKLSTTATTTFSNFPMLFSVTDNDLKYTSFGGKVGKTDGTDIVFTSSDGITKLDHEIEKYSSSTGETIIWVRIPTLSAASDTTLYVYFGNSGAADQQNVTGVWNSQYEGVYHIPNGSTISTADSTNQNNATNNGATANSGQIDGGGLFNGSSAYAQASTSPIVAGTASFTISAWIRTTSYNTTYGKSIYAERAASGNDIVKLDSTDLGSPNGVFLTYRNSAGSLTQVRGPAIINDNKLHYVVGTLSGGVLNVYVDGKLDASGARNGNDTLTDANKRSWFGGDYQDPNAYFNGTLDEVRVSSSARSIDWIATEFNNQSSPGTFYAYGPLGVQNRAGAGNKIADRGSSGLTWYSSSWGYRKPVTIDKNKLSTTATTTFSNFPMLFSVTDTDLKYTSFGGKVGKTDGTDIVFTSSDGITKLDHEIEKYSSSTGETIIWVRIPTLSAASDTTLYVYFGNSGAADQQNVSSVWSGNYRGVWHMHNASSPATDSRNGISLSQANGVTFGDSGQIGYAVRGDGGDDELTASATSTLNIASTITVSAWLKINDYGENGPIIQKRNQSTYCNTDYNYGFWILQTSGYPAFEYGSSCTAITDSSSPIGTGRWVHLAIVVDEVGDTVKFYRNGILTSSQSHTGTMPSAGSGSTDVLGYSNTDTNTYNMDGNIDSLKISADAKSQDWIVSEFNNQNSPSTFYAYGALSTINRQDSGGSSESTVKVRGGVKFR